MMYYRIDGPKIWHVEEARYVVGEPDGDMVIDLFNGDDLMPEDMFRDWLKGCGLPMGELKPVAETRAAKLAEIMAAYSAAFAPIEAVYPQKERETWPIQLEEARACLANPDAETPMLSILVSTRGKGETVAEFAAIVMANNAMYRQFAAFITGQQQRMYAEVNELDSAEAVTAYEVRYETPAGLEGYIGG